MSWQVALCAAAFAAGRICKVSVKSPSQCRKPPLQARAGWTIMVWRAVRAAARARLAAAECHECRGRCSCCACRDLSSTCVGVCPGSLLVLQTHPSTPVAAFAQGQGVGGMTNAQTAPGLPGTAVCHVLTLDRILRAP